MNEASVPLIGFAAYMLGVVFLAWMSARVRSKGSFVSEYFLGNRGLGVWALALTFAATAASGGSFVGFPAYIYAHGWVLALWIAGYMVVPIVGMGLLGKRLNQVSQKSGALTLPEVFTHRLSSPAAGAVATFFIAFFMFCYLLAQFKAGSQILATLLIDVPLFQTAVSWVHAAKSPIPWVQHADADYLLCLTIFAVVVIAYVVYGGFRAVVWTDVMQGVIMLFGVLIMLVLVLQQTGGLNAANQRLAAMTPPEHGSAIVSRADSSGELTLRKGEWVPTDTGIVRLAKPCVFEAGQTDSATVAILNVTTPWEIERLRERHGSSSYLASIQETTPYASGAGQAGVYVSAPGPHKENVNGFLPFTLAFSFFVFWAFGTAGQPSNMVRLMAFQKTKTLRYAMVTVTVYFSLIYFTLVVIFCCGRTLLHGMEIDPDRTMPQLATVLTSNAGMPWLAGLLLAAPFAAVMSSVDSFLLVASSSIVRDIYQRYVNPHAPERRLKVLSYAATALIGAAAFIFSIRPAEYLQEIIVFASGGVASAFLVPMAAALFWPRLNGAGGIGGMVAGAGVFLLFSYMKWAPLSLSTFIWAQIGAGVGIVAVTLLTPKPSPELVRTYFE